ncbi:hypothetical protein CCACVL1_29090 [Corchorus capsularis]|uniref:Uncharacterized protein n=1 Tax=Corchorus capsularis TaxID=210143 RepID=A0A1R3G3W4_COCAP|nr:hypothetical protein CCACVL1_29090 [Corchorus capsularis]
MSSAHSHVESDSGSCFHLTSTCVKTFLACFTWRLFKISSGSKIG